MKCPKCGSYKIATYKHPNAKEWCVRCAFVLRDEGATEYNKYPDEPRTRYEAEQEEIPFNPEDMNIIVLTDEHLQKIITEAVKDGIKEYQEQEKEKEALTLCGLVKLSDGTVKSVAEEMKKIKKSGLNT